MGEQSFEITCALDEGQVKPDEPIRGWLFRVAELASWGGYFALLDESREALFHAALSEVPTATLRLPDGREAVVSIQGRPDPVRGRPLDRLKDRHPR